MPKCYQCGTRYALNRNCDCKEPDDREPETERRSEEDSRAVSWVDEEERLGNMGEWEDGMNANQGGMDLHANPHIPGSDEFNAWELGWKDASSSNG